MSSPIKLDCVKHYRGLKAPIAIPLSLFDRDSSRFEAPTGTKPPGTGSRSPFHPAAKSLSLVNPTVSNEDASEGVLAALRREECPLAVRRLPRLASASHGGQGRTGVRRSRRKAVTSARTDGPGPMYWLSSTTTELSLPKTAPSSKTSPPA